jgi:signal transduction histidine kinase/CheY-like chemotaxis protein
MDVRRQLRPVRDLIAFIIALVIAAALLIWLAPPQNPSLHNILDSGIFVLSGVLTLLLWDMGWRLNERLPKYAAIAFGVTCAFEMIHALVAVEFSDNNQFMRDFGQHFRPGSWPPPAYLLPIGLIAAVLLSQVERNAGLILGISLLVAGAGMFMLFSWLPRYTEPHLGITRPTLVLVPMCWLLVHLVYRRRGEGDRIARLLSLFALIALLANIGIIFSRVPADDAAMFSHVGKFFARLFLLSSLTQLGTVDMARRMRHERDLRGLTENLAEDLRDRHAKLEVINTELRREMAHREQAEKRTHEQLERLHLLRQITHAIGERQDLDSIFQAVVRRLEDSMPVDFACLCRYEQVERILTLARIGSKGAKLADAVGLREGESVDVGVNGLSRSLHGHLIYEQDTQSLQFELPVKFASAGLRSLVIAPLVLERRGAVFGVVLIARNSPHAFSSGECEFLNQLCSQVALAVDQAQLHASLQHAYDDMRNTQDAVMQQERLRSLGQMASGIAHDVNNAISPVSLYLDMLLKGEHGLSDRGRVQLETMRRSIDDVANTISRMGVFYRKRDTERELVPVNVNVVIGQIPDLTRARWSDIAQSNGVVIKLHVEEMSESPTIMAVESELREALINLVLNAADAMPRGGNITLRTRSLGAAEAGRPTVLVEVADDGVGMDEETRRRCFEPFYTTKGDRGTGLGLAMVYGIAERHGAELEIESARGQGTTVRLRFASADNEPAKSLVRQAPTGTARRRILLVDDDPILLRSLRDALEFDGHEVACADGGQAGIDAFLSSAGAGRPYSVVITDLGMPHIDGRRVAVAVKDCCPETLVLMLTGWGQRMAATEPLPVSVDKVLSKPPNMWQLREALSASRDS